jgi:signal transduction histidine kinase/CheY-like chemotaxis protein
MVPPRHSMSAHRFSFNKMRTYVFVAMVSVLLIPTALTIRNNFQVAYERELDKVEEAHLVIAQNLSSTLQRYAEDAIATFEYVVNERQGQVDVDALKKLLSSFDFRYVATLSLSNDQTSEMFTAHFGALDAETLQRIRDNAQRGPTQISGVVQIEGKPFLVLSQMSDADTIAIGVMDTDFLIAQQSAIAFGVRGHAMIVDQFGRVLAHPKPEWTQTSKDASGLAVVQNMMNGITGVMQFFSPPLQADMIAGFTSVPATGWGVMVPQPIAELRKAASVEANQVTQLLILSFIIATLASWGLAGLLTKPIESLSQVVTTVRDGDLSVRAPKFSRWTPKELGQLRDLLNGLLESWSENNKMLEGSLKAAKAANAKKTEAISVLSHEMRTPLNGIVGAIELFRKTDLSKDQAEYVQVLDTSAKTLLGHVNSVLEVSRLDAQTVHIDISEINLTELLEEIVNENLAQARKAGVGIVVSSDQGGTTAIETDLKLLRAIASNLVSNAVKFTIDGQVKVEAKVASNDMLELKVIDTGHGIEAADIERIFEPFTVINASYRRNFDGTGLGLHIAALSAEALGGKIEVTSKIGSGSEFRVEIPVRRVFETSSNKTASIFETAAAPITEMNFLPEGQSVLVVDDNLINREVLAELVRRLGHVPTLAADGPAALEIAMVKPFDLLLLDISMPEVDGTDVARLLREHEGPNQKTKIIAQTAHASPKDHDAFIEAGIDSVLIKPIRLDQLQSVFDTRTEPRIQAQSQDALEQGNVIDQKQFELLSSASGASKAIRTLEKLLEEIVEVVEDLNDRSPETSQDSNLLSRVHNVAGASAMLGAEQLHKILHGIESELKQDATAPLADVVDLAKLKVGQTRSEALRITADSENRHPSYRSRNQSGKSGNAATVADFRVK